MTSNRHRLHRLAALIAAAIVALTLVSATPAEAASPYFQLRGFNGGDPFDPKCASVGGASMENGAPVISWDCKPFDGGAEQVWRWEGSSIVNSNSNKCLAIGDSSREQGARAIQWICDSTKRDQRWEKISAGAGNGWILRNVASRYVLAISGGSHTDGAWVIQWAYSGNAEQRWMERHI